MPQIKVSYFPSEGRAEAVRLALSIGGLEFEDHRIQFADWPATKPTTPWGAVPVLEWDGKILSQSNSINRFIGKKTGLYPTDDWEAAKCDEVCGQYLLFEDILFITQIMDVIEYASNPISATFGLTGDALVTARAKLANETLPFFLGRLEEALKATGGSYFAGGKV